MDSTRPSGVTKLKIIHLPAAAVSCATSKATCAASLFLTQEGEYMLSTIGLALSAVAALLAAFFLDAAMGFPVARTISRLVKGPARARTATETGR